MPDKSTCHGGSTWADLIEWQTIKVSAVVRVDPGPAFDRTSCQLLRPGRRWPVTRSCCVLVQDVVVARLTYAIDRERFEPDGWQARANGPD